jgi:hypothetical protein
MNPKQSCFGVETGLAKPAAAKSDIHPMSSSTSRFQCAVQDALTRCGLHCAAEAPVLHGLLRVDLTTQWRGVSFVVSCDSQCGPLGRVCGMR